MTQILSQFFVDIFQGNVLLATFLLSLIPVFELKGAIPFGMSNSFWGANALSSWTALGISFLGSTLVLPFIVIIFRPIIRRLDNYKFFHSIIKFFTDDIRNTSSFIKAHKKTGSVKNILIKMLYILLFVAFPVPLTGVWSGTCFAVLLGLDFWQICISVVLGNFICGLLVTFVCVIFPNSTNIILYVFFALFIFMMTIKFIVHFVKKHNNKKKDKEIDTAKKVKEKPIIEIAEKINNTTIINAEEKFVDKQIIKNTEKLYLFGSQKINDIKKFKYNQK